MKDHSELIAQMTLEEKASLCSGRDFWHLKGVPRLGVPSLMVTDGPHGLRVQLGDPTKPELTNTVPATCFPTASALAATWNRELIGEVGQALAEECRAEGVGVILGPGANIKRSPLCGRNFEYFSEDPYLSGEIARSHISGVQSLGVGTSLKHYAVNNQEYRRMTIDAVVDQRALREIYLAGFEIAVKGAQPWTVMGAYNQVNGSYACEHTSLLKEILIEEWGHEGLRVTDWGAMNDRVEALKAGLELEMPGPSPGNDALIAAAVREGRLEERVLDGAVEQVLALIFKARDALRGDFTYDPEAHHALARKAAGEGAVLLKNQGALLPLRDGASVAVIGRMAREPRYQGAGSSLVNPTRLDNIYAELVKIAGEERVSYAPGYAADAGAVDQELIAEATSLAGKSEVTVVCAGLPETFETEGLDREHMRLPESQNQLIGALAEANPNLVVVLSNGSPVEMPWIDRVPAVLEGYLGGQAGAGAIAGILTGRINPSGKLAETFPVRLEDTPAQAYFPGGPRIVEYRESVFVGYRFFDQVDKDVLFPFGHGLSYTTFAYSGLTLSADRIGEDEKLTVSLTVENTGKVAGKEIIQLYVSPTAPTAFRPVKELKGFSKVDLKPGQAQEITFELDRRAFAYYSTQHQGWQVESGQYQVLVGASSRDIRLRASLEVGSRHAATEVGERDRLPVYRNFPTDAAVSRADFERLLGHPLPDNQPERKGSYTLNTPVGEMGGSLAGRWLGGYINKQLQELITEDPESPNALMMRSMVKQMPLRALVLMGGQTVDRGVLDGLLTMVNGSFFRGLLAAIRAVWKAS